MIKNARRLKLECMRGYALLALLCAQAVFAADSTPGQITLQGAVRFPGVYYLQPDEKVSQLLQRAGGLTKDAYPFGAKLLRPSAKQAEAEMNHRTARALEQMAASVAKRDSSVGTVQALRDVIVRVRSVIPVGRVPVQADPAVLAAKLELDLPLHAGDLLYIPIRPDLVHVKGEVRAPGPASFRTNTPAEAYLRQAGGLTKQADKERIFLLLPDGTTRRLKLSSWNHERTEVPPGSVIVVARRMRALHDSELARVDEIRIQLAAAGVAQ